MGSCSAVDKELADRPHKVKKPPCRKNPWGNRSYADLITQAIQNAPEKRLTLSQIYEWMVKNIPHFKDKGENNSSAGWKNSIRHNLSLHTRFVRIQNEGTGKSSWWVIDPTAGEGRATRRRSTGKGDRARPFRRHRQKPKAEQPKSKALVALQNSTFVTNFRHQISQSNKCYDGFIAPNSMPYRSAMHLADNRRQRWHSSSSCSSDEFNCNEARSYRKISPVFLQANSSHPESISSLSLEYELEDDRTEFSPHKRQPNDHYETPPWYQMPSPYCSSDLVDDFALPSEGGFWDSRRQNFQTHLSGIPIKSDMLYEQDPLNRSQQINAPINAGSAEHSEESNSILKVQERYNHHSEDFTKSGGPEYLKDVDMTSFDTLEYSSPEHPIDADDSYSSIRSCFHLYGDLSEIRSTYFLDSSSDLSDSSNYDCSHTNRLGTSKILIEDEILLPPDLCVCEVLSGLDCDITEVFQLEMDIEGSLEFLESFGALFDV